MLYFLDFSINFYYNCIKISNFVVEFSQLLIYFWFILEKFMDIFDSWITNTPIANRGLYGEDVPENSIAAIKKAMKKGYGVCVDVRALSDGTIIVFHDETLGRLTSTDGFINNCTYADIEDLYLGKTKEKIPTLKQILDTIDGKVPLLVDIRNMDKIGCEKHVWKVLQNYNGEYAVVSANPYSLEWFKLNAPTVKRGQVSSFYKHSDLPFSVRFSYKRMKLNKDISEPNFIVYKAEDLPNRFVKKYKNLPLLAYHVNSLEAYEKVKKFVNNVVFEGFEI